jgi:DNA mismatch repair ATPase MutS
MAEQTPLMVQYQSIKEQHPTEVLFFRLGDFYEMFNDDAVEVSRLLNLTLTHRGSSPMCGIPYHASKIYIARLLRLGKKIAICEQVGDPKAKGLTERKVVEIITPGAVTEEEYLEYGTNNFLAAICFVKETKKTLVSFSYIDVSTGNFYATHWDKQDFSEHFLKELARCSPKDQDMKGEKTGCFIAECRATINFLRAIKENELKPSLNAYNHLYYSMNMSKRFNPDSYENYMLQRKIAQVENDIETINKTIAETKAILNTYMNQKAEAWSKIRKIRQVDKI